MHSSESPPAPPPTGPPLLEQLGRVIIRARSRSPCKAAPSTSQVVTQPRKVERPCVEEQLDSHIQALWHDQIPICIEVFLAPDCADCFTKLTQCETEAFHKPAPGLLLERWTMSVFLKKNHETQSLITSQWLLNAVRSQLHFSQLSAWLARINAKDEEGGERRRKLSRESCKFKKTEPSTEDKRNLNVLYSITIPGETYRTSDFVKTPLNHTFPLTDIGLKYLKVVLQSLPRTDIIPSVKCRCRKTSKDLSEDLTVKLKDLTLKTEVLDDRMHNECKENGKHKCSCDEESYTNNRRSKNIDERRLKEIAKYKRRLRKERKSSSSNSEGDKKETTSIPILQASRFDRFRAIGCYRNQAYLTLPASRIETKQQILVDPIQIPEYKKTCTIATQTDNCVCGSQLVLKCENCDRGMVRSEANFNLVEASKCDKNCDNKISFDEQIIKRARVKRYPIVERLEKIVTDRNEKFNQKTNRDERKSNLDETKSNHEEKKSSHDEEKSNLDEKQSNLDKKKSNQDLKINPRTYKSSVGDDYVSYEKCDYGTFDSVENLESPKELTPEISKNADADIPSPSEMEKFRWRFDSAASMIFHSKTGLPLTSSPAPLKRGNNCFDYDDSINGISGIKSALFHPIPTPSSSPISPPPVPSPRITSRFGHEQNGRVKVASSAGLLDPLIQSEFLDQSHPLLLFDKSLKLKRTFEESALKGRLEPAATVHGFTAELGASGSFCPPHKRLPVAVFFYAPGGTNAPYMGHINLGSSGYRVPPSGTIQVSLFNPHGTLVKMFVVLYDLTEMPPASKTFLRQRTLYLPAGSREPPQKNLHEFMRYLIHLRFMTSKSGKLYLHTDIRIIVSRKADLDAATAHSAILKNPTNHSAGNRDLEKSTNRNSALSTNQNAGMNDHGKSANQKPCRVFGGSSDMELCYEKTGVSYELRSFTYGPENPKYSPR